MVSWRSLIPTSQSHCKTSTLCVTRLQKCRKGGCMLQNVKITELDEIFSSNIWAVEALCFWLHDSRQGMGLSTDWAELVHVASSGQPGYFPPPSTAKVQQGCTFGGCSYIQIFKDQTKRREKEVEFTHFCSWSGCSWARLCLCSLCRAGKIRHTPKSWLVTWPERQRTLGIPRLHKAADRLCNKVMISQ